MSFLSQFAIPITCYINSNYTVNHALNTISSLQNNIQKNYKKLGYHAVGELHLNGVYEYTDKQENHEKYEDLCIDMIKRV